VTSSSDIYKKPSTSAVIFHSWPVEDILMLKNHNRKI